MWNFNDVIKGIYIFLGVILVILIPYMCILKRRELANKEKKEEDARKKAENDRQKMLGFYESSIERNYMEIEKLKKEKLG